MGGREVGVAIVSRRDRRAQLRFLIEVRKGVKSWRVLVYDVRVCVCVRACVRVWIDRNVIHTLKTKVHHTDTH